MDNNILAHDHGIKQIELLNYMGVRIDFNQGLDAGFIDNNTAKFLSNVKFLKPLRMACDSKGSMNLVEKAVRHLRWHNVTPSRYFCYVLVKDVDEAVERVKFLKSLYIDPFAQPYRDFENNIKPSRRQRRFTRWVNHKSLFKTMTWEDYEASRGDLI